MAYARRGFFCAGAGLGEASVVAVMGLGRIVGLVVIFAENGLGNDIFFGGPVAEVAQAAALTAKGEVGVRLGIGWSLANRATMLHFRALVVFLLPRQYSLAENAKRGAGGDTRQRFRGRHARGCKRLARSGAGKNFDDAADQVIGVGLGDLDAHDVSRRRALAAGQFDVREIKLAVNVRRHAL